LEKYNFELSANLFDLDYRLNRRNHMGALVLIELLNTLCECASIFYMPNVIFVKRKRKFIIIFGSHYNLFNFMCII
jgi:hypothetical protein